MIKIIWQKRKMRVWMRERKRSGFRIRLSSQKRRKNFFYWLDATKNAWWRSIMNQALQCILNGDVCVWSWKRSGIGLSSKAYCITFHVLHTKESSTYAWNIESERWSMSLSIFETNELRACDQWNGSKETHRFEIGLIERMGRRRRMQMIVLIANKRSIHATD